MKAVGDILACLLLGILLSGCGGGGGGGGGEVVSVGGDDTVVLLPDILFTLEDLDLSPGVLDQVFQPSQADYTATVGYLARTITVTPTASDTTATVSVNGQAVASGSASAPIPLAVGENRIEIDITTEGGENIGSYTLTVTRQTADDFAQQAYIKASSSSENDQFGYSLALSGDTLAVGTYLEDSELTGIIDDASDVLTDDSLEDAGAVYVFTRDGGTWSRQAYIKAPNADYRDHFGISLALDGDTLAVGADREDSSATGIGTGDDDNNLMDDSGAVYVFTRAGGTWSRQAYIKASNTGADDRFGTSLALHGDTLAVGANQEDGNATGIGTGDEGNDALTENSGAVYVFTRAGDSWSQQAYIKASNTDNNDHFGISVALDGDTLAVGADLEDGSSTGIGTGDEGNDILTENSGAVYVFTRAGDSWSQQAYIKASNTDKGDTFGWKVALSGDTLAVGAALEDGSTTGINAGDEGNDILTENSGAVYVFTRAGDSWSQQAYIKASNTDANDRFGISVALSDDTLAVGADYEDSSATGIGTGDAGNDALAENSGAVYLFTREGETWSQQSCVKGASPDKADYFAYSVALAGDTLAVGTPAEDSNATGINGDSSDNSLSGSGAAFIFR